MRDDRVADIPGIQGQEYFVADFAQEATQEEPIRELATFVVWRIHAIRRFHSNRHGVRSRENCLPKKEVARLTAGGPEESVPPAIRSDHSAPFPRGCGGAKNPFPACAASLSAGPPRGLSPRGDFGPKSKIGKTTT